MRVPLAAHHDSATCDRCLMAEALGQFATQMKFGMGASVERCHARFACNERRAFGHGGRVETVDRVDRVAFAADKETVSRPGTNGCSRAAAR